MFPSRTDADARRLSLAIILSVALYALLAGAFALAIALGAFGASSSRRVARFGSVYLTLDRQDVGNRPVAGVPISDAEARVSTGPAVEATASAVEATALAVARDQGSGAGSDLAAGNDRGAGGEAVGPDGGLEAGARAFHDLLAARVRARLIYPAVARRRGEEGIVLIDLSVKADGSLAAARVSTGSGSAVLDRAALDLVRSLFPFDPPPGGDYTIPLRIQYLLR